MWEEGTGKRRRKLVWAALSLAIVIIVAFAVVYVNISSNLNSALIHSLNTFDLVSVEYSSVSPGAIDMNITLSLDNPTEYAIRIDTMMLSFSVDETDIGLNVNVEPNQDIPPGEKSFFYFLRHVTDGDVLMSLNNQTYELTVRGRIGISVSYSINEASLSRDLEFVTEADGVG